MMYEFPYSPNFEDPPAPKPARSCLMSNAIELFEASASSIFQPFEQRQLLSDFRRHWLLIADDLSRVSRGLPNTEQAGFLADVHSVLKEIERRRFKPHPRFEPRAQSRPEQLL
jgi:hypothetical protein